MKSESFLFVKGRVVVYTCEVHRAYAVCGGVKSKRQRTERFRTCASAHVLQGLLLRLLAFAAHSTTVAAGGGDARREDEEALDLPHYAAERGMDAGCVYFEDVSSVCMVGGDGRGCVYVGGYPPVLEMRREASAPMR